MCTMKKLALDCLGDFSLSLYPFHFGCTLTLEMQQNCSVLKPLSFLSGWRIKTILQNGLSTFAWPAKILDLVQKLLGQASGDCIKNGSGESK